LRREHNLQLFENKLLKKLSGPGIDYVDGEQRISEVLNIIIYRAHLVMQSVTLTQHSISCKKCIAGESCIH